MSNANNSCIPRLRFPGFEGEWEEKKLGEVFTRLTNKNAENNKNVLTISAQYGLISQLDFFKKSVSAVDVTGYYLLQKGDFAYNKSSSQGKPVGAIKPLKLYDKGVVSTLYICFRCKDPKAVGFWEQYFDAGIFDKEIMSIAQEGARNHGLLNVPTNDYFGLTILMPTPAEQQKIASCLSELDNLIAAQGQKVDALKEKKKGLMQQLFPQPGETTPRLRFPGFEGEWVEKKVSACLEERNEQFPESEDYPLMAFVAEKGVTPKGEKYDRSALVKDAANKKYKRTEFGDFIYSSNNLESGSIGFNTYGSACISPVYSIFKSKNNVDSTFIGTLLTQKRFISEMVKYRQGVVYGQWKIPEKEFLEIKISLPSISEQQKIASCLSSLDDLIAAESAKVEALKDHKKGLMQQLFPQPTK